MPFLLTEQDKLGNRPDKTEITPDVSESLSPNADYTEVVIGSEQSTTFPNKIGTSVCNALIDTGATRSCISEKYFQNQSLTKTQFIQNISVRSATGSNLVPIGIAHCTFELGETKFNGGFIVCKNLTRLPILGRDFLIQNHVSV